MRKTFYCKTYTNVSPYTEKEKETITNDLKKAGFSDTDVFNYIYPDTCKKQCDSCVNEMLENRSNTKKLVDKLNNKNV